MGGGYIGFFDSGVGGITLLAEFCRRYPGERTVYLGDNANAPYGGRGEEEIYRLTRAALCRLAERFPLRAAVIACNTATAACIEALRAEFPFPLVGVEPALAPAAAAVPGGRVLLLCTPAALACARIGALVKNTRGVSVVCHAPAGLAADVEKNIFRLSRIDLSRHLPQGSFDAAVLGCTHYVFLRRRISSALRCPVFDGNLGTADHLAAVLNICSKNPQKRAKIAPIFTGEAKKKNKSVFFRYI